MVHKMVCLCSSPVSMSRLSKHYGGLRSNRIPKGVHAFVKLSKSQNRLKVRLLRYEQSTSNRRNASNYRVMAKPSPEESPEKEEEVSTQLAQGLANIVASPVSYLGAAVIVAALTSQINLNAISVVLLSFLPVVGLTLISKSSVGEKIRKSVDDSREGLLIKAQQAEEARQEAKKSGASAKYFGEARNRALPWSGGSASHLTGELIGDAGFDPFGFGRNVNDEVVENFQADAGENDDQTADMPSYSWRAGAHSSSRLGAQVQAELLHARWAMLGAVGCLIPEALDHYFGIAIAEPIWWKVGASVLNDGIAINYAGLEGFRIAGDKGVLAIAACQLALMGGPEYARLVGIESLEPVGIFLPGDVNYPGGPLFDPIGLAEDPEVFLDQAVREIKNGRLAMIAMAGYAAQAAVTHAGPLENLEKFLADPLHENIVHYLF